ncbi:MAG TPA: hypothetical protein PKW55_07605 [Spirochaetota bacterium]|nr:hypothetical protein [Spirochaetota bacterium]HOM38650.1 hypothetical protein [Spirochaetota bacterium]HPQ49834.1 hypothetical protein [Spirochaetota bacterium]
MIKKISVIILLLILQTIAFTQNEEKNEDKKDEGAKKEYNIKEVLKLYQTKNYEKARETLEIWLKNSPSTFPVSGFLLLGNIYDHFQLFDAALKVYQKGMDLAENKFPFIINLSQVYRHMKNHQESIKLLLSIENKANFYPEIYLFMGMSYFELRDRLKTIGVWEKYLDLKPDGPKPDKVRKALAWLKQKDFKWPEELEKESKDKAKELEDFIKDLKETIKSDTMKNIKENTSIKEKDVKIKDKGKEEGKRFDEIER